MRKQRREHEDDLTTFGKHSGHHWARVQLILYRAQTYWSVPKVVWLGLQSRQSRLEILQT